MEKPVKEHGKGNGTEVERGESRRGHRSVQRTKAREPSTRTIQGTNRTLR